METARRHAVAAGQSFFERAARGRVGLVPLPGRDRSARRNQQSLAALRNRESIALDHRALSGHDGFDQDGKGALHLRHAGAALFHVRRDVQRGVFENPLARSAARLFEWR